MTAYSTWTTRSARTSTCPRTGELTVRRLLSHTAGLQREPHGDVWDTLRTPALDELVADLARSERVLPPARRFHYSNLGIALLGHAAGRLRGGIWAEVLADRVLTPLGLSATGVQPGPDAATGFLVDAYSDHARPEPRTDLGALGPAAQLWSTAPDMARWAAFLADPAAVDPAGAVLRPATLDEMRWPLTVTDETLWIGGFGLGLILVPQGERATGRRSVDGDRILHVGHDGAMPGFLASVYGRRGGAGTAGAMGCAVFGSSGTGAEVLDLSHRLLAASAQDDPADIEPWTPGEPAPERYRGLLGRWWGEGGTARCAPAARTTRPAGHRRSSSRCPTGRTRCVPSPAGRRGSCCGSPGTSGEPWYGCTGRPTGSPVPRRPSTGSTSGRPIRRSARLGVLPGVVCDRSVDHGAVVEAAGPSSPITA